MHRHAAWIISAALLAFAVEGLLGTVGEGLSHSSGMPRSIIGIIGATVFFWLYSVITEPTPKKPTPKTPKSKR